jgi:hypothetical protein
MNDARETAWDWYADSKTATMCSNEATWIKKLTALAEQYPDDVEIRKTPEENHGVILVNLPKKWFKIKPPTKRTMTDEQRAALAERMKNVRAKL